MVQAPLTQRVNFILNDTDRLLKKLFPPKISGIRIFSKYPETKIQLAKFGKILIPGVLSKPEHIITPEGIINLFANWGSLNFGAGEFWYWISSLKTTKREETIRDI